MDIALIIAAILFTGGSLIYSNRRADKSPGRILLTMSVVSAVVGIFIKLFQ